MKKSTLVLISRITRKANLSGKITDENAQEIVKSLTEFHTDLFSKEIEKLIMKAANTYDSLDGANDKYYELVMSQVEEIFSLLDIKLDFPGLYPTFELDRRGKHFCETNVESALKQYNNFWDHW